MERLKDFIVSSREYPTDKPVKRCEYCGNERHYVGFLRDGGVVWMPQPAPCECEESQAALMALKREQEQEFYRKEAENRQKAAQRRIDRLTENTGMNKRFRQRTFENYKPKTQQQYKVLKTAQRYADTFETRLDQGTGLLLTGGVGTGKTHIAAAITNSLTPNGYSVLFRTSIEMLADIRKSYDGGMSEDEVLKTYKTCDLLIIDDLGKEKSTEWGAATIYSILNARYESLKPVIITTNFTTKELATRLGEEPTRAKAIVSRLVESTVAISMDWEDYRQL